MRFKGYRVESNRLRGYDYAENGWYFLTLCTFDRRPHFGSIIDRKMNLFRKGTIVKEEWEKSFQIRKELSLETYVIMPNHLHAIVIIKGASFVETTGRSSLQKINVYPKGPATKSVSSFIAGFKSASTKRINLEENNAKRPIWQANYYDHIIRSEKELYAIREYIKNNPINWEQDEHFKSY
jgi:REP element-mobilizing transposase RayT